MYSHVDTDSHYINASIKNNYLFFDYFIGEIHICPGVNWQVG